jgi:hypothetical protein
VLEAMLRAGMVAARIDLTWGGLDFHRATLAALNVSSRGSCAVRQWHCRGAALHSVLYSSTGDQCCVQQREYFFRSVWWTQYREACASWAAGQYHTLAVGKLALSGSVGVEVLHCTGHQQHDHSCLAAPAQRLACSGG